MSSTESKAGRGAHTPGPWNANGLGVSCAVDARENTSICICTPNFRDDGSPYANARLIAAAPDLLAALKLFICEHDDTYAGESMTAEMAAFIDAARAAIRRATGESS